MANFNFIGGSYAGRSKDINSQRTINLYPVLDQEGGKVPIALYGTPGFSEFCDTGTAAEGRGAIVVGSYLYAVCGDDFYQIDSTGTATDKGTLDSSTGHCWLAYNGPAGGQICVIDGTTGYIYDITAGAFAEITDADFPGATSLTFQDGYFIVTKPDSGEFWVSDSYDGTAWDGTYYATAEGWPDDIKAAFSDHRELWLYGDETTEVWYNSGSGSPPFDRKIDEIIQTGLGAAASPASLDNTLFWFDNHRRAIRAEGYRPIVISTRQIEYQWAQYGTVSDAIGWAMVMEGHSFYVLTFPSAGYTWVYDAATGFWHERESWFSNTRTRWRANWYAKFGSKHLIGDFANGKIYELDNDVYAEDGEILKAIRTSAPVHKDRKWMFHHSLEIEHESGVGLAAGQGSDPQAVIDWSDDGGHVWSNEHWVSLGKIGEYDKRQRLTRLGRSRNRIYRETITDPVKRVIMGGHIDVTMGRS